MKKLTENPSAEEILSWQHRLLGIYGSRNSEFAVLRKSFDGDYISNQQWNAAGVGELVDHKRLVYNMINTIVRRNMDEMTAPLQVYAVPRGLDDEHIALAEKRQKLLSDWMEYERFTIKIAMAAYLQALLDKAIFHVRPEPDSPFKAKLDLVLPEAYLPIPSSDNWFDKDAVILSYRPFEIDKLERQDPSGVVHNAVVAAEQTTVEYWTKDLFVRIHDGKETHRLRHGFGVVPIEVAHNIPIPHRERGQGDADQSVGLNIALNQMLSDEQDVLAYLANPIVVIRGSRQGTQGLVFAPRATWELERDAAAEILSWAGSPPSFETQILRIMQGIEDSTGHSSPAFGREVPSGVSGETIRSILAGFNTRIGAKQTFMGAAVNRVAQLYQLILEKAFPSAVFEIEGDYEGRRYDSLTLSPKEFKGWYKTQTIWQPQNETVRVFTEIQKHQAGLQSRYTTMRRIGVMRPGDEYRRILMEKQVDATLNAMQAGHLPAQPGPGMPAGRDPRQMQQPFLDKSVRDLAAELQAANPGTLAELMGAPADMPGRKDTGPVEVAEIMDMLRGENFAGKVWLEGPMVEDEGVATGELTFRVADPADIPRLRDILGPLAARAKFVLDEQSPRKGAVLLVAKPGRDRRKERDEERPGTAFAPPFASAPMTTGIPAPLPRPAAMPLPPSQPRMPGGGHGGH